jgi:hypothetical protein
VPRIYSLLKQICTKFASSSISVFISVHNTVKEVLQCYANVTYSLSVVFVSNNKELHDNLLADPGCMTKS